MFNDTIDRCWLLTWTTYGSWLPGDDRGFVSPVRDSSGRKLIFNKPDTIPQPGNSQLESYAQSALKCPPIRLGAPHAKLLFEQFRETAGVRSWQLMAVAIMATHVHLSAGVVGDPEPEQLLGDFKRFGSRRLNTEFGRPMSGTWWTSSGSTRKLPDEQAVLNSVRYIRDQEYSLCMWVADLL